MRKTHRQGRVPVPIPAESGLLALDLSPDAMAAIARQGFISAERRGRRSRVYKLRFRLSGRQVVRYLGTDAGHAQAIQAALDAWQAKRRMELYLRSRLIQSRAITRSCKLRLEKYVAQGGLRFHGFAIRKPRSKPGTAATSARSSQLSRH
jgi:hypothetical protein